MEQTQIVVDGRTLSAETGELLIEALDRSGIVLPKVCYHPALGPLQTCDSCMVEVGGQLQRACATRVTPGLVVETRSAVAKAAQNAAFDQLLSRHLLYCTICDNNNGDCQVHQTTALLGVEHQSLPYRPAQDPPDFSNPFYRYDPSQCILCGRCVEACQNVQVNETLSIRWEDEQPRVLWDGGSPIGESSCVSCGHCVTVCPCNALMETAMLGRAGLLSALPSKVADPMVTLVKGLEPELGFQAIQAVSDLEATARAAGGRLKRTKTVCTYCGVGCSFDVLTKGRELLRVEPGRGPANGISTCVKGKFGWSFVNDPKRLTKPLLRDGAGFREVEWQEALAFVAGRIRAIASEYGPDALGFIASSKCSNEEAYLTQKLARQVVGTHNVDNCSRYCQAPATTGLFRTVGYGGDSGSIRDIERAGLVLIIGSNTAESHPVLATRVKRAHKLYGQTLVVADLREHEMARRADLFLRPQPGTDQIWIHALSRYLLDHGLEDRDFLDRRVDGLEAFRASLEPYTLEYAERACGVPAATLADLAERIASAKGVCVLWAMGVTQHGGGSDTSTAISNLLLLSGNYGRPGTGAYPLRGHNNVQGASDMGAMPNLLPGYQPLEPEVTSRFEAAWGVKLPAQPGLDNHEMVDAALEGRLRGLYLIGEEMGLVDSNLNKVHQAFRSLELLVVQDIFFSETCRFADVVLPACPSLEKEGTFTSTERRIQHFSPALEPLGESRPDWQILCQLAGALGAKWEYAGPAQVMQEIAALTPLYAGVSYDRLAGYRSLQWPVAPDGVDAPLLYTESFAFPGGRAKLYPTEYRPPLEQTDAEYDLHLNNGRLLEHFHEGNMTYRVPGIAAITPSAFLEVSPELAAERGIASGQWVRLTSRHGSLRIQAEVTARVFGRQLYLPMNSTDAPVNLLTGSHTDAVTHTPAYKEVAVRMEVLPERGLAPLPKSNPRHGRPTPQRGVEVERKWQAAARRRNHDG